MIGRFITTTHLLMHHTSCRVFGERSNHLCDSAPLQHRFGTLCLLDFPKTKITFEREEIYFKQIDEIQENMMGQLMVIGRTVWGSKEPTLKGTEASMSYLQCFLYLLSSSVSLYFSYYMDGYFLNRPLIL